MPETTSRGGARRASRSLRQTRRERRRERRQEQYGGRRALRSVEPDPVVPAPVVPAPVVPAPEERPTGGRRALRPPRRRTRGLAGTIGLTVVGAAVPGTGYLFAGRKRIGVLVLLGWAVVAGLVGWYFGRDWKRALDLVFDPTALKVAIGVVAALLLTWFTVVWTSYRMIRPEERPRWHTVVGNIAVVVICAAFAAPVVRVAQYGLATADFVQDVFDDNETATIPDDVSAQNPWGGRDRVNVLLLGGDGGEGRDGVRTDSVILLDINTESGRTISFSLPRNMMNAQFPEDSPLYDLYPYGFTDGSGSAEYMLNAVYRNVPAMHPGVLGESSNEGADAIKLAVEGTLGIRVDYYVLVNLEGFKEVVDAMGGVTVNINEPIAIQGNTDAGIPPVDWLEPGPDQHLDGFEALWFARGRYGSDDYERMERQRCMVDAIIDAADPANLLLRYIDLLKAGKEIVYTDIPNELGAAFTDLALKVKGQKVKSVVFRSSERFNSADPDFEYVQETVQNAVNPPPRDPNKKRGKSSAEPAEDACAYNPTGETVEDAMAGY